MPRKAIKIRKAVINKILNTLKYDPKTGEITRDGRSALIKAPSISHDTKTIYLAVCMTVKGEESRLCASRVAWLLHYGEWILKPIYYNDKNPHNLQIDNLVMQENANTSRISKKKMSNAFNSKYKGVYPQATGTNWRAQINHNHVRYHIGVYQSEEEAALAYNEKATELLGDFAVLNDLGELT